MIKFEPLHDYFGVDISGFDIKNPSGSDIDAIANAVHDNFVARIRGQDFNDNDQLKFTRYFGEISTPTLKQTLGRDQKGTPDFMSTVSNVEINGEKIGQFGNEELDWHTDLNYKERPHAWSLLHAIELPKRGGDTYFLNTRLAYENLPYKLKRRIDGMVARHDVWNLSIQKGNENHGHLMEGIDPPDNYQEKEWWKTHNGIEHPLVRTHPITQKKALYFGRRLNLYIPGIPYQESEDLINSLFEHCMNNPNFLWVQKWYIGDLIIWDNRSGMHKRSPFDNKERRVMRRTNTQGERPY